MSHNLIWIVLLLPTSGVSLLADDLVKTEDIRGRIQKLDEQRQTVTIRIDGRDNTYPLRKDIRFFDDISRELRGGLPEARKYFKEGQEVVLTVERRKEQIGIRLQAAPRPKK
jgi:hypothetical protein